MFSPRLISETRLGFTRQRTFFPNALQNTNAAEAAGIANVNNPAVAYSGGLPILSIGGFTSLGESNIQPFITIANNYQAIQHLSGCVAATALSSAGVDPSPVQLLPGSESTR